MAVWMMTSRDKLEPNCHSKTWKQPMGLLTDVLLLLTEHLEDTVTDITIGELDIVLGVTVILHQGQEVIIGDVQLEKGLLVMGWLNPM